GELLRVAADMSMRSLSFGAALQELAGLLTRLQIVQCAPASLDDEDPDRPRLLELASRLSPEFVQLAYQIVIHGRTDLPMAPDEYAGFMMTLLRLHGFRPDSVADVVSSIKSVSRAAPMRIVAEAAASSAIVHPKVQPAPAVAYKADAAGGEWHEIVAALSLNGLARELAHHCELRELGETECVLRLAPAHGHLQMKPAPDKLQQALREHLGRPLVLRFELAQTESDTPAATVGRERRERQEQAIASIEQDSFVRDVIEGFDASLVESTIKPIE
ncbi:MAG: DNA polymerase III subunit gamma/tau C-terminal domain-containing protein, partial [Azonexus sp.]